MVVLGLAAIGPTPGFTQGTCMKTEAQGRLERSVDGCVSPVGLCLQGTVGGKGGLLEGATWVFTAVAATPGAAGVSITGETVISARTGTLTTSTDGRIDREARTIVLVDRVTKASVMEPRLMGSREVFEKGIGVIGTKGAGRLEDGFQVEITGEVCLSK
jgi:hypothetical protein